MKYLLISFFLLATNAVLAAECNKYSLTGTYTFRGDAMVAIPSDAVTTPTYMSGAFAGKITFEAFLGRDLKNGIISSVKAFYTQDGDVSGNRTAVGTYKVFTSCIVTAWLYWTDGSTPTRMRLYLDRMIAVPALPRNAPDTETNYSFHAVGVVWEESDGVSSDVELFSTIAPEQLSTEWQPEQQQPLL